MRRRKIPNQEKKGADEWIVTYGDLVTLLLTFFVMLFSFSTIDAQKWKSLVTSLAGGGNGILEGGRVIVGSTDTGEDPSIDDFLGLVPSGSEDYIELDNEKDEDSSETDEFIQLYRAMEGFLEEKGILGEVKISDTYTEILLRFKDTVLFDTGEAKIKDNAKEILDGISEILKEFDDQISRVRVDGHADSRPINTKLYPTNWELSASRSVNVVRYLAEERGLKPSKLSQASYGEFYPIEDNSTAAGMARNRRVEIFIVKTGEPTEIIGSEQ